ncbi:Protein deadpan [Toxocara canis]|uniref:Protein deadpan n=2 Tax=Toxocara canis TaxID=6265 RepID=A0A0B2VXS1_TOXCA|nr:Protein deadpan [Toxocara canis]VDM45046.1 unnamed protein product [Toxocara canis]
MEKRRRARMNECLDQLKQLLLHVAPHQRSKLEKADILEMTVAYLQQLHQRPVASPRSTLDGTTIYRQSYIDGFSMASAACVDYVGRTLAGDETMPHYHRFGVDLLHHLQSLLYAQLHLAANQDGGLPLRDASGRMRTRIKVSLPPCSLIQSSSLHNSPAPFLPSNLQISGSDFSHSVRTSSLSGVVATVAAATGTSTHSPSDVTAADQLSLQTISHGSSSPYSFSPDAVLQISPSSADSLDNSRFSPSLVATSAHQALFRCTKADKNDAKRLWRPF